MTPGIFLNPSPNLFFNARISLSLPIGLSGNSGIFSPSTSGKLSKLIEELLPSSSPSVSVNSNKYFVELALTNQERALGLMNRENLPSSQGMLFIFDEERVLSFWMKNTLIPLDIVFINSDFEVVSVAKAVPCESDPCPTYPSAGPAKYVLEVNPASGITAGNVAVFSNV